MIRVNLIKDVLRSNLISEIYDEPKLCDEKEPHK